MSPTTFRPTSDAGADDPGSTRLPCVRFDRARRILRHMTDSNDERGDKRGVLSTDRAKSLDKTKDADADAADDDEHED